MGSIFDWERFREQQRTKAVQAKRKARQEAKARDKKEERLERQHKVREERKKRKEAKERERRRLAKFDAIQAKIDADIKKLQEDAKKERDGDAREAKEAKIRELEEQRATQAADYAEFQAAEEARRASERKEGAVKTRGRKRGLVMADVRSFDEAIADAIAAFDLGLSEAGNPVEPQMPVFLSSPGVLGRWGTPAAYHVDYGIERWIYDGAPSGAPQEELVEGTYYEATSDVEFDALWGGWLANVGPMVNILLNAEGLREHIAPLVGSRGLSRREWQPGKMDWDAFADALATVKPEASLAWNLAYEGIPTPPQSITLTNFSEGGETRVDSEGDPYFITLKRPENHSIEGAGFEVAQNLWDAWIDNLAEAYGELVTAHAALVASRPALERAKSALRMFRRGSQYHFRGQ